MRISTGMIFDSGVNSIQQRTSSLLRTQQQISSGRRILSPSDDPVAAARALEVTQSKEINVQYLTAQDNAKSSLGVMDGQLSSATDLFARVRELTVQAGNAALTPADRKSIALELRTRFDELVGLANSTDGSGQYLFSGYQGTNKPFAGSVDSGVAYVGDDGQRTLRLSGSRNLPVSQSGNDLFMRIKNGNGTFVTGTATEESANVHSVNIDAGTVSDATLWNAAANPDNIELRFWTDAAGSSVNTKGYAAGNVSFANLSLAAPLTIDSLAPVPNNQFNLSLDGGTTTVPVTVADGAYVTSAALAAAVQAGIDTALGMASPNPGSATVSLDAANQLVVTSNALPVGSGSSVTLSTIGGNNGAGDLFGSPSQTNGLSSIPGQTFYDLVDKSTGNSLFTGAPSATGGGGSYTHPYSNAAAIPLSNVGPAGTIAFDFGASVSVSGAPMNGDAFAIARSNGSLKTSPATITHANATIDKGVVTDPVKWSSASNSQDLEARFWVDAAGSIGPAGATYYDLVDAKTGDSLFSGAPSVAGGPGNTYTQPFASVHGALTGVQDLSGGTTVVSGINDTLSLTVDGVAKSVSLTPGGPYTPAQLAGQINSAAIGVTAGVDPTGKFLVLESNSTLGTSAVAVTAPPSNGAAALLGAASTGSILSYGSSTVINLKGIGFDFGASVTINGNPANGDSFTIKASNDALGNGYFVTAPRTVATDNMGSGIIGAGEVFDASKWNSSYNSKQLEVRFWKDPADVSANAPVYYDLVDTRTEKSLFSDTASTIGGATNTYSHVFKSGDPIAFTDLADPYKDFGVSVTIQGTPASGDAFRLQDSTNESVFDTLSGLIHALESPVGPVGSNSNAGLHNKLGFALTNFSMVEDNFLRVRADVGTRLAEVDDLGGVSGNLSLQYEETLSRLQDLDYAKAITDLTRMQTELQAAQQSFVKISGLSLFNYL